MFGVFVAIAGDPNLCGIWTGNIVTAISLVGGLAQLAAPTGLAGVHALWFAALLVFGVFLLDSA